MYPDGRMDTRNASKYVGLSVKTLAMHRCKGTGATFTKKGRIYYFKDDLDDWIASGVALTTAQCQQRKNINSK